MTSGHSAFGTTHVHVCQLRYTATITVLDKRITGAITLLLGLSPLHFGGRFLVGLLNLEFVQKNEAHSQCLRIITVSGSKETNHVKFI